MRPLDVVVAFHDEGAIAAGLGALVGVIEGIILGLLAGIDRQDVGGWNLGGDGLIGEGDWLAEGFGGHGDIVRQGCVGLHPFWNQVAVGDGMELFGCRAGAAHGVGAFAVFGEEGIDVDDVGDAIGDAVGDAGDDHAAVAVADEDDVVKIFVKNDVDDVGDVRVEINVGRGEMDALALAGEGGAIDGVAVGGEKVIDFFECPSAAPGAVDDDVSEGGFGGIGRLGGCRFRVLGMPHPERRALITSITII